MKKLIMFLCAVTLAFVMVGTANAATIMFDFDGTSGPSLSKVFTDTGGSGATLTVTGYRMPHQTSVPVTQEKVSQTDRGLGVKVNAADSGLLDSFDFNEALLFTISGVPGLILDQIRFTRYDQGDDITFYIDRSPPPSPWFPPNDPVLGPGFDPGGNVWDISNDLSAAARTALSSFSIKVNKYPSRTDEDAEGLRVLSVYAEPIPEPATIALLGIGLAGLAGAEARRRRKKKAVDNS